MTAMTPGTPSKSTLGLATREVLEERERCTLAPFAAKAGDSRGRCHPEKQDDFRTAFQRDRDRIVHSAAFRRLEYKTQVFVNHVGDHYRTRLTHTMEVAQIARAVSRTLCLNEDLAETVALVHDVGHPPFGHSGERALQACMKESGGFEHNKQALRVVDVIERRYPDRQGLNLTHEVRESILKHARTDEAGDPGGDLAPLLEAQVVDIADMIAYNNHDIDDGLYSGLLDEGDFASLSLVQEAGAQVDREWPGLDPKLRWRRVVTTLIHRSVSDLVLSSLELLQAASIGSPSEARRSPGRLIGFSREMWKKQKELARFLEKNLYANHRVIRMQVKAERFIRRMFSAYLDDPRQLPPEYRLTENEGGLHRGICDYMAGMTDRYAQDSYKKMFHPFERI